MVNQVNHMIDQSQRRITSSYQIVLVFIALLVIMILLVNGYLSRSQEEVAILITTAEKQRMLVQKSMTITADMVATPIMERREKLQMLYNTVDELERTHVTLMQRDENNILVRLFKYQYYDPPEGVDMPVEKYLQQIHEVLRLPIERTTILAPEINDILTEQNDGALPAALDKWISGYQEEASHQLRWLTLCTQEMCVMALILLFAMTIVILRPAVAYIEQAQRRIYELNRLKGDFLANMSHEIRTPMNGIFGMTELLQDSNLTKQQENYVLTLQHSADHLLELINDILDFSKLEAGQMRLDPVSFNLLATIEEIIGMLAVKTQGKNLELLLHYTADTPNIIVADIGRTRQLLFNLIGNAIKFTDHGYVLVKVEVLILNGKPWINIHIEDTGIGIPEDKIDGLFEKFTQVESSSSRAHQGTGLGLAICQNLVKLMGGAIKVESTPGKGSTFSWRIPLVAAKQQEKENINTSLLAGKKILVVDDLMPNRVLYKEVLQNAGIFCLVAENAEEALSILAYERDKGEIIDAILIDYIMPNVNGLELLQTIRKTYSAEQLPAIFLDSTSTLELHQQWKINGAQGMLAKPVTRKNLFQMLYQILAHGQQNIIEMVNPILNSDPYISGKRTLAGTRVLLVEDYRINRMIATEMLEQLGCIVTGVENGKFAIEEATAHKFDIILMDCQMPEMDGFEASRRLRAMIQAGQLAPVPIIAFTANALSGDLERCLQSGMDDYITKPVRKVVMEDVIVKWLRKSKEQLPPEIIDNDIITYVEPSVVEKIRQEECIALPMLEKLHAVMGDKTSTILRCFLEDGEIFIQQIAQAINNNDLPAAVSPAHTFKCAAGQIGASVLAKYAERTEHAARGLLVEDFGFLVPAMHTELIEVGNFLKRTVYMQENV